MYTPRYIIYEEAKCFFKLGDIVRLPNGNIEQVVSICTGGYALTDSLSTDLRGRNDAELLFRSYEAGEA